MVLTVNSDSFPKQHFNQLIFGAETMCFLRGTN
jgi:hypothetical protein